MTPPRTPSLVSLAPRLATPRDLVTPFISVYDHGTAVNGSVVFGNVATGNWNVSALLMTSVAVTHRVRESHKCKRPFSQHSCKDLTPHFPAAYAWRHISMSRVHLHCVGLRLALWTPQRVSSR